MTNHPDHVCEVGLGTLKMLSCWEILWAGSGMMWISRFYGSRKYFWNTELVLYMHHEHSPSLEYKLLLGNSSVLGFKEIADNRKIQTICKSRGMRRRNHMSSSASFNNYKLMTKLASWLRPLPTSQLPM